MACRHNGPISPRSRWPLRFAVDLDHARRWEPRQLLQVWEVAWASKSRSPHALRLAATHFAVPPGQKRNSTANRGTMSTLLGDVREQQAYQSTNNAVALTTSAGREMAVFVLGGVEWAAVSTETPSHCGCRGERSRMRYGRQPAFISATDSCTGSSLAAHVGQGTKVSILPYSVDHVRASLRGRLGTGYPIPSTIAFLFTRCIVAPFLLSGRETHYLPMGSVRAAVLVEP